MPFLDHYLTRYHFNVLESAHRNCSNPSPCPTSFGGLISYSMSPSRARRPLRLHLTWSSSTWMTYLHQRSLLPLRYMHDIALILTRFSRGLWSLFSVVGTYRSVLFFCSAYVFSFFLFFPNPRTRGTRRTRKIRRRLKRPQHRQLKPLLKRQRQKRRRR